LHRLAVQMYAWLSSGHNGLAYNVDPRGAALTGVDKDGKRYVVEETGVGVGENAPAWQRAREIVPRTNAKTVDRRFNARVLEKHLTGSYSVAPAAAGWVQWVCLDIDAHAAGGATDLVARRLARAQADRVLALVWRAFGCSAERHPIVLRSPGGGYHVWFPLTRGPSSLNAEHTWPAMTLRGWFERHLVEAGAEIALGVLEVFPSGRCLRAPCGRGMVLLRATRPNDPDALGLEPWPGTMAPRVEWAGVRDQLVAPVRQVIPMVETFLAQWDAQRRTPADWMRRPEAAWDPTWGPLAYRDDDEPGEGLGRHESAPPGGEKNSGAEPGGQHTRPQQSDDSPHGGPAGLSAGSAGEAGRKGGKGKGRRGASGVRRQSGVGGVGDAEVRTPEENIGPSAVEVDTPPDLAGDRLVRGPEFRKKKNDLLVHGVTKPSTRHDAVLFLSFYWYATCGHDIERTLALLSRWCGAFAHAGSSLSPKPEQFRTTCLREARHYLEHYAHRWPFRGRGDGGGLGTLTTADHAVLAAVDPQVRREAAVMLAWLAGRVDADGRIGEPVYMAAKLLERLCGDVRVDEDGKQRRATVVAIAELERLGVLTLASNYRVGSRPRSWCCWYQFGSGVLPRTVEMPAATWEALEPSGFGVRPASGLAVVPETRQDAPSAPLVVVRVVGERAVPEGLVSVLSDGARGRPRTLVTVARDVGRPTAEPAPSERPAWFVRPFQARQFTPGELWTANAATVTPFPDVEARRRMTRRERLAAAGVWVGASSVRDALDEQEPAQVIPLRSEAPPEPISPEPAAPAVAAEPATAPPLATRSELEREVGAAADALPEDLVDIVTRAVRSWRKHDP
jgi:hypothetical protein